MFSKIYGVFNENVDYMRFIIIYWYYVVIVLWKVFDLIEFYVG